MGMDSRKSSVSLPAATRADHEKFCNAEGWRCVRSARGKNTTHHDTYEMDLPSGDVLRTRVPRPLNRTTYGPALWSHILSDHLDVTPEEFWRCVSDGILLDRGEPAAPPQAIPTQVLYRLKHRAGLSDSQLAELTPETATERLNQYWTTGQ